MKHLDGLSAGREQNAKQLSVTRRACTTAPRGRGGVLLEHDRCCKQPGEELANQKHEAIYRTPGLAQQLNCVSNNRSYRKEIKTHKLSHSSDRSALILNICVFKCKHQNENVPGFSCKPRSRATHVPPEHSLIRPSGPLCS